jgi:hypothetical protein
MSTCQLRVGRDQRPACGVTPTGVPRSSPAPNPPLRARRCCCPRRAAPACTPRGRTARGRRGHARAEPDRDCLQTAERGNRSAVLERSSPSPPSGLQHVVV